MRLPGPLRMLTPRGAGLLASALVLWALARLLGVPELQMAAVACAALVAAAVLQLLGRGTALRARRRVTPARLFHDARGGVELTLRNDGRLPTGALQVQDATPDALPASAGFVLAPLRSGGRATLRYELHGQQRGVHRVGPVTVRVRDPFGLAARPLEVGGTDQVVVYPPVHRLAAGLPLRGRAGSGGATRARPGASGDELSTVREYVRGDDLRRVHWRATAHRGELMIRQDEAPQRPDALLVLDTRVHAHRGVGPRSSLETAVATTASVAYHLAEHGFDSALATTALSGQPRPLPWELTLEQLAGVQADPTTDLPALWQQLATSATGSGVLVAISCLPEPELLRRMVRAGRGAALRLALLVDAEAHGRGSRRGADPARTAAALRSAGWRVTVLGPDDHLPTRWRELLAGGDRSTGASGLARAGGRR